MSEPKYLEVSATEKPELEKGESGVSSANVGTEARESVNAKETNVGINLTEQKGTPTGNTEKRGLSVSNEKRGMTYVNDTNAQGNAPRILDDKKRRVIVNTITVDEVKKLIKLLGGSASGKIGFDAVVVEELPDVGESGVIYLIENQGEAPNVYDEYIWIKSKNKFEMIGTTEVDLTDYYTKEESDEKYVDLTSNQEISGIKTLLAALQFGNQSLEIYKDGNLLKIKTGGQDTLVLGASSSTFNSNLRANADNFRDLGQANIRWKDFYIAGKIKDGTNEFDYSTIGFPVITAPSSTTLTDTQFETIKTGCRVEGTFLGVLNPVFMPCGHESFGEVRGKIFYVDFLVTKEAVYSINTSTKVIQKFEGESARSNDYECVRRVNGKQLPAFPTSNTEPVVPTIAPNGGALNWSDILTLLQSVPGYDGTKNQTLKNTAGTIAWVDD